MDNRIGDEKEEDYSKQIQTRAASWFGWDWLGQCNIKMLMTKVGRVKRVEGRGTGLYYLPCLANWQFGYMNILKQDGCIPYQTNSL